MRERLSTPDGLVLRAWAERDVPALLVAFASAEMRMQVNGALDTADAALGWVRLRQDAWATGTGYVFAVTDADDAVLG
ncbi:MAG TPA: hypothetical protein VGL06_21440, partial [Pseudonocardiaceae bacterium]